LEKVRLLKDICGSVQGRFLVVMGPSGSGKTTFLNQLSMRGNGYEVEAGKVTCCCLWCEEIRMQSMCFVCFALSSSCSEIYILFVFFRFCSCVFDLCCLMQLTVDGQAYSKTQIKHMSGYVMQDDILFGQLTVEETLTYAARLKMHPSTTAAKRAQKVNKVSHAFVTSFFVVMSVPQLVDQGDQAAGPGSVSQCRGRFALRDRNQRRTGQQVGLVWF
jgi:ABC-type uncharacterized transport system YnjBCD ATPase subunit